jgi:hypothetical protein
VHLPRHLDGARMAAFTSIAVERFACDLDAGTGSPPPRAAGRDPGTQERQRQRQRQEPRKRRAEFATDSLLFAGAPVWALDWCPWRAVRAAPGPLEAVELLAVSTHPKGIPRTRMGAAQRGAGSFQLWAVPHGAAAEEEAGGGGGGQGNAAAAGAAGAGEGAGRDGGGGSSATAPTTAAAAALPRCLALIQHNGRLAWDLQWCPNPSALLSAGPAAAANGARGGGGSKGGSDGDLQGILAAVLGDGCVAVYTVPSIERLEELASLRHQGQQRQRRQRRQQPGQQGRGSCSKEASDEEMADPDAAADGGSGWQADGAAVAEAAAAAGVALLDLEPAAALVPEAMGGSLASCCQWCPSAPHDTLLVGCWDGHVCIWQLPTAAGGGDGPSETQMRAGERGKCFPDGRQDGAPAQPVGRRQGGRRGPSLSAPAAPQRHAAASLCPAPRLPRPR